MHRWGLPGTAVLQPAQTSLLPSEQCGRAQVVAACENRVLRKGSSLGRGGGAGVVFDPIPVIFPCV